MPGTLYVVATPIGNLEDITLRALRTLREVTVIAAEDTRRTATLLQHYQVNTQTTSLHDHNERQKTPALLARLTAGESIALVSDAGTPLLSDPGFHFVRAAIAAGIPVQAIPGPSALTAALAVSGLPADSFVFLGFPPPRAAARGRWLAALRRESRTVVLFETPHRVRQTLQDIRAMWGDRHIVMARELTKVHETVQRGWVSDLLREDWPERGEFVLLVSSDTRPTAAESEPQSDATIRASFAQLTNNSRLSRRDAVAAVAAKHAVPRQRVYRALGSDPSLAE